VSRSATPTERRISVNFHRLSEPGQRLLVFTKACFGGAGDCEPHMGERVARTKAQRFEDISLDFLSPASVRFGDLNRNSIQ
jgi:hypothetical protein